MRPTRSDDGPSQVLTVRMTDAEVKAITACASARGWSRSEWIRRATARVVRHEQEHPPEGRVL